MKLRAIGLSPGCRRAEVGCVVMPDRKRKHWIFLGDFEDHAVRESYRGAAEYAASRPHLDLVPWSEYPGRGGEPSRLDLRRADGIFLPDVDLPLLGRGANRLRVPFVGLSLSPSARNRGIPAIFIDNHAVGQMAAEHLLQRGYRRLAYFGIPGLEWSEMRGAGFRRAAAARGVSVRSYDILPNALQVNRPSLLRTRERAWMSVLQTLPKPCGVFAACDTGACYLIRQARELGLRIPDEIGVIGVDDNPIAGSEAGMALSTVELPCREMGHRAAALLDSLMQGKKPPNPPPFLPLRVIARTSTDTFMVDDPLVQRALRLIEERRTEGLTVEEVVRELRTTPVTLGRRFREHLKTTPAKHILHRRLEYAKDLLRTGHLTVTQVSDACGFHDCSYFGQVFKRVTGTSPGSWQPKRQGSLRA